MQGTRWWRRSGSLAALIALVITGCGETGGGAGDDGKAIAVQFLDELRAGRLEPAWQGSSTEFKSLMGIENLRDYVRTRPAFKAAAEHVETRPIERDGRVMAEHVFQATIKSRGKPATATITVLLAYGDDGWKVEQVAVQ